jgi:putative PIN family toxin of toxin-antitoxin system
MMVPVSGPPLRVLVDTNVLVSAVLFGGVPQDILEAARGGSITGIVSLHILGEFREVLSRPRFGVDVTLADSLAEEIAGFCRVVPVERASGSWSRDADDDPVVEAAIRAGAHVVVTGDAHLLELELPGLEIVTPAALAVELGILSGRD